ncbi:MAG: helix-turn-helix transcriptional regulator [Anaerobutyricum hallii]|uniref:helix-turn-helix transcriptional regulator n=2 Tax=Anaerobutyricum hallii TaxID=39488 RepID=UPI00399131F1
MPIGDEMKILLAEQMKRKGLSYRQLEILTGISKSTLCNIATGKRIPRMDTMEKLAEHLHVRIEDLYESECK